MAASSDHVIALQSNESQSFTHSYGMPFHSIRDVPASNEPGEDDRYRQLMAPSANGVLVALRSRVAGANHAAARLLGYTDPGQLKGHLLSELLVSADRSAISLEDTQSPQEKTLRLPSGGEVEVDLAITPFNGMGHEEGWIVVLRDAGAHKRIAATLSNQDRYLHLITDAVPALIGYIDAKEIYRFANTAYESWFAKPRNEIIGHSAREVLGPIYEQARPYLAKALSGETCHYELTVNNALGKRHVMAAYTPDKGPDGTVYGISTMVLDITARKSAEQMAEEQERQLRLVTDALPVFIAQCDTDYRLSFVNKTYADRFGYRPGDVIGKRIPDLIGDAAFAEMRQFIDAALQGRPQEHEMTVTTPDGKDHYMHMMYVPEFEEHGAVRGIVAAISDVTRVRDAEEQLHRREREFETLVENSPDIISRIDRNMRHVYVNPAIEKLAGLKASAYPGKTNAELGLPASVVRAWDDAASAAFSTGVPQKLDFDHMVDGEMRYFSGRVVPEVDRYGHIESAVVIAYDVTDRARMEKERDELLARERTARIQAETAARARDEFLAIVSHELRAPLNGIQSWAHVLENYVKDVTSAPLAQRALQGIKTGVGQQVRLIEDLLDVTRMMSGKLRLVKQPLALLPALQSAVESIRTMAAAKRIGIICTYRITNEQIEGDADRVQQVFWNLLSNAIKFTPEGGNVWLTASASGQEICVQIRDDGVGISPDFLPHLFDRFSQEDTSSTRDHSGLGLGLFIVRHLIDLHGGRVSAESAGEGKGTTFCVYFPLRDRSNKYLTVRPPDDSSAHTMPLPSLEGVRILLIDDQEEARESLTVVLTGACAEVFAASCAREALAWLEGREGDTLPDVVVSDIAMPGEDGYTVLRRIRSWKASSGEMPLQRVPALALTAFAQREDRIRALTAGFQMHVTKPVAPEELIVVIDTMVTRSER